MSAISDVLSIGLIERDKNADVLLTWQYPILPEGSLAAVRPKLALSESGVVPPEFLFVRYKENWAYAVTTTAAPFAALPKLSAVTILLFAKNFNPEKYKDFASKLLVVYTATASPPKVLAAFLAVTTKGSHNFGGSLGALSFADYDDRRALAVVSLKSLVQSFAVESILIYNAVLLKKRIVVYSSSIDKLLDVTRTLPALAWHRQNWSTVRPYLLFEDSELQELAALGGYIAGFTDRSIESREDLYDLFLDADAKTVIVAQAGKADFAMGKAHKELAQFMITTANDPNTANEGALIKAISQRTKQFLATLEELVDASTGKISAETIKAKEYPAALSRFYWNLALAEDKANL